MFMFQTYNQYLMDAEITLVEDVRKTIIRDFSTSLKNRRHLIDKYFPANFDQEYDCVWFESKTAKFIWQKQDLKFLGVSQRFSIRQPFHVEGILCFEVCGVEIRKNVTFDLVFDLNCMGWSTDENSKKKVSWEIFQQNFKLYTFDKHTNLQDLDLNYNYIQYINDENKKLKTLV